MPIEDLFSRPKGVASKDPYTPSLPPWYGSCPGGICWWCLKPVLTRDGRLADKIKIHTDCLMEAFQVFDPDGLGARAVADRSSWLCAACGAPLRQCCEDGGPWEVDHIIPLADALPHANDFLWPYRSPNLRALCRPCYLKKLEKDSALWYRRRERALWAKAKATQAGQGGDA